LTPIGRARFIAQHKRPLSKFITHRFKLDEAERASDVRDPIQSGLRRGDIATAKVDPD
jgi:threonine dehydrogenase-like Zn-dependent dehydrogenase